jgi:hypothetical protein
MFVAAVRLSLLRKCHFQSGPICLRLAKLKIIKVFFMSLFPRVGALLSKLGSQQVIIFFREYETFILIFLDICLVPIR